MTRRKTIDQEGYNRLQAALVKLNQELSEIQSQIRQIKASEGPNLFDSPAYLQVKVQEQDKCRQIARLEEEVSQISVVENIFDEKTVGFGDKVTVEISYSDGDMETTSFTLVSSRPDISNGEISQNSPIGMFVFGKQIGDFGEVKLPNCEIAKIKIINKE